MILKLQRGDDVREWDFKPERLMATEAIAIEKMTGQPFGEDQNKMRSMHALVWVLLKRDEPTLKYTDVDFAIGDLTVDLDEEEQAAADREQDDQDGQGNGPADESG